MKNPLVRYIANMLLFTFEVIGAALVLGWLELTPHYGLIPAPALYAVQMPLLFAFYFYICYIEHQEQGEENKEDDYTSTTVHATQRAQ